MSTPVSTDFATNTISKIDPSSTTSTTTSTTPSVITNGNGSSSLPASESGNAIVKPSISVEKEAINEAVDEAKGGTVHNFSPTATPSEKAAQIKASSGANSLASIDTSALSSLSTNPNIKELNSFKQAGGSEMMSDVGNTNKEGTITSVTTTTALGKEELAKGTVDEKVDLLEKVDVEEIGKTPPGALPTSKVRDIPDWFAIGWTGQDKALFISPDEVRARSVLADFVGDVYYGQWYQNAGIIVFAVVSSHFITLFGGGWAWLIIIMAFCATYYQTSIKRTRRNVRDDMAREVAKKGLKSDVESATWMNHFMTRFWLIYEPVLSATIVASVDQVLSVSTPAFLDSIRMTTFTLGTKPPRIDHVRTFPDTEDDVVMMEWAVSFTPNDVQDMTYSAAARKVNPKIILNIRIGVGPAVVGKDIIVEDLAFTGTMRIKMKLMNNFPHVQLVDLSFMQPPVFDFILKPIGFDLSIIPGLTGFITNQVHATLGPMMYEPNTFTLNLEQMLSGAPIDTACGVLAITIYNGRGVKGTKLAGGAPDPYVSISVAGRAELAKTSVKKSTMTPHWNETKYILLNNLNDVLSLSVKDWNDHRPDSELGICNFDLKSLAEDGQQENKSGDIILDGKARGQLKFDAIYYPIITPKKLADGTQELIPETKCGVVRLTVHQAKELDPRGQQINPYVNVSLNDKVVHRTQTLKRTPSPIWERPAEFLVTEKASAVIGLNIKDENSMVNDTSLGFVKIKLTDLFDANGKQLDWFPLTGAKSGRIRVTAEWKPVMMVGAHSGADAYTPPIGVMKIWLKRAKDVKNVEAMTGGKSDPYVRILNGGVIMARTLIINNNLDPEWDEIIYVQVHSPKDRFLVEVMDYQHLTKDRSLGSTELTVAPYLVAGEDKKDLPWKSTGTFAKKEVLKTEPHGNIHGHLEFEATFYPCAHLKNISFSEPVSDTIKEDDESFVSAVTTTTDKASVISQHTNPSVTTLSSPTASGRLSISESIRPKIDLDEGIVIPREQLLRTQSGILAFQIISGQLTKKGARLEILFDDGYWPTYSTEHARSPKAVWDEIGEAFIRELDYSQIILKLNTAEKDTREDIIASHSMDMNAFLEACLDKAATFVLTDGMGGNRNTVVISAKYIPVDITLEPRESVNNSGLLRVDLLDGKNIPAVDRGGKSDPFAQFELNGVKVHKSEVVKKSLAPVWNETFELPILSRVAASFKVTVYDWDRVGSSTKLGTGMIDLSGLEPIESTEVVVELNDPKTGKPGNAGSVRVRLLFRPQFLTRTRQSTSTFSSAGKIATSLGATGIQGVGAVGMLGVNGVGAAGKLGINTVGAVGSGGLAVGKFGVQGVGAVGKGVFGGMKKVGNFATGNSNKDSSRESSSSSSSPLPSSPLSNSQIHDQFTPVSAYPTPIPEDAIATPNFDTRSSSSILPSDATSNGTNGGFMVDNDGPSLASTLAPPTPTKSAIVSSQGTVSITILELKGQDGSNDKRLVSVRSKGKTIGVTSAHKGDPARFDETFTIKTNDGPCDLDFTVLHHKMIGSDTPIGSYNVNALDHVGPTSPTAKVLVDVSGTSAKLELAFSWMPVPNSSNDDAKSTKSISSSKKLKSRMSMIGSSSPKH